MPRRRGGRFCSAARRALFRDRCGAGIKSRKNNCVPPSRLLPPLQAFNPVPSSNFTFFSSFLSFFPLSPNQSRDSALPGVWLGLGTSPAGSQPPASFSLTVPDPPPFRSPAPCSSPAPLEALLPKKPAQQQERTSLVHFQISRTLNQSLVKLKVRFACSARYFPWLVPACSSLSHHFSFLSLSWLEKFLPSSSFQPFDFNLLQYIFPAFFLPLLPLTTNKLVGPSPTLVPSSPKKTP